MALVSMMSYILCISVLTTLTGHGSTFILDASTCSAVPPCACSGTAIFCDSKGLSKFPKFKVSSISSDEIDFYFQSNQLTTIPANAFRNITVLRNISITVHLDSNQLYVIATNAFAGIAHGITHLYLDYNNFTGIPQEFQTLTRLQTLQIRDNPIATLDATTMNMIGRSLNSLRIDLNYFETWPVQLDLLTSLIFLSVRSLNTTRLALDAFDGLASTLPRLAIIFSQIDQVPSAISRLGVLNELYLRYNNLVSIGGSDFSTLSELRILDLSYNPIEYISPHAFDGNVALTTLILQHTSLRQIPDAVSGMEDLISISLSGSLIECNCEMFVPKGLNLRSMTIVGHCKTSSEEIEMFLKYNLPNCPK